MLLKNHIGSSCPAANPNFLLVLTDGQALVVAVADQTGRWCLVVGLLNGTVVAWQCWMNVMTAVVAAVDQRSMLLLGVVVAAVALEVDQLPLILLVLMHPPEVAQGSACMLGCARHPRHCGAS